MQIRSMENQSFYRYASILTNLTQLHFLPQASHSGSATQENVHVPGELLTSGQAGTPQRGAWSSRWDYKSHCPLIGPVHLFFTGAGKRYTSYGSSVLSQVKSDGISSLHTITLLQSWV